MNDVQRIEEKLKHELKVTLNAPVTFAQFTSYMNELSRGRVDPQITEEIWGQMVEAEATPTLRRFPAIFLEAIQRIDGKLAQLDQQIKEAREVPPTSVSAADFNLKPEYLVFRALELVGAADPGLLLEFEQSGRSSRIPYANFRNLDALIRGYDRMVPLRVRLVNAISQVGEASFEVFSAEAGQGIRATVEKLLPALGPQCSIFCQLQIVRSASDYAGSLRAFNEENLVNLDEIRGEFKRIRENIGMIFPSDVINYPRLPPLVIDSEGQLSFRNNVLYGYTLLDLVDVRVAEKYSAQSAKHNDYAMSSMRSDDRVPITSAAHIGLSAASPGEVGRPPMNLSPFAASTGAPLTTPLVAPTGNFSNYGPGVGFNASWNPKFELILYLSAGLAIISAACCSGRSAFPALLTALGYVFWHHFRNEHDYHIPPTFFISGFALALAFDFLWVLTQVRWVWIRGGPGTQGTPFLDRISVVLTFPCLALEAGLIYFLFLISTQGVYPISSYPPTTVKRPPFMPVF